MRLSVYLLRRVLLLLPVIIGVVSITFVLVSALPIPTRLTALYGSPNPHDPWIYSPTEPCPAPHSSQQCYNPTYYYFLNRSGLSAPVPVQWATYVGNIFTFHWGYVSNGSTVAFAFPETAGQPVTTVLSWFLPYTIELVALAMGILLVVALPLGRLGAANRNRPVDHAARALSFTGFALPTYLLGSILITVFVLVVGYKSGFFGQSAWCPAGETTWQEVLGSWPSSFCFPDNQYPGWLTMGVISHPTGFPTLDAFLNGAPWLGADTLLRLIFPAVVIAFAHLGLLLRYVRNGTLEVMNLDYVRTARASGFSERVVVNWYTARNSLTLTVTVLAVSFATFFGWLPIAELLFQLNGVGLIVALGAQSGGGGIDYGIITGATLTLTFMVVVANVIADIIVAYLDPRVRLGETLAI
ncbi:MAG: ABC transporter permease [Thermoplasmata archaeon]|nr:ABC transporter permease [Thermoplasmata archaeon]